ncbi:GNAT family N-acetyltransferase [Luteipulveratus flavus]|uniref:N-acetyltransferase n=1 Tax=Luteipulveratus flavus TaxID=3031728 RepID=A0ABT6C388_9MICO|nr:N-acetyltransferase [Luteipulveratus sp. YIM 133296]MDF8263106.1 N-acetyltransferase [Luteipulveratus sp. YIM 133296]
MTTHRSERADDHDAVRGVVADAFGDQKVPALVDAMRLSPAWLDLSFVAEDDGGIVGHVAFTRALLDTRRALVDVLVLSPVSVAPAAQGRGIGSGLIRWALEELRASAWPMVFLEGAPGYYARFGFESGEERGHRRPSLRVPAPAFQVLPLPAAQEWMIGTLVYPQVFWDLDCVGLRDPDLEQVEHALGVG